MSLINQFFEEYDNLMIEQGGVETFWRGITDKKICQYIRKARRDKQMPPPTQLKYLENYLDNQFILQCMQYYSDRYPDRMTARMDMALDEFTFKYRRTCVGAWCIVRLADSNRSASHTSQTIK